MNILALGNKVNCNLYLCRYYLNWHFNRQNVSISWMFTKIYLFGLFCLIIQPM